jgi:hypothetical protein
MMVFLLDAMVDSFALQHRRGLETDPKIGPADGETYALARWLMNTVALLVSARMALACICVLGGSTPFARRVMMDLGSVRS